MISGTITIELREGSTWDFEPNERYTRVISIPEFDQDVDLVADHMGDAVTATIKKASAGLA